MGTHPIFESDFDCLTDLKMEKIENGKSESKPDPETEKEKAPVKLPRKRKTARPTRSGSPRRTRSSDFYTSMVEEAIRLSKLEEETKETKRGKNDTPSDDPKRKEPKNSTKPEKPEIKKDTKKGSKKQTSSKKDEKEQN